MKILAIRGQSLASLAETFEVELATGPLAGAGLFAITGPTGAGKSTLLDALCLALFDRTPRLTGKKKRREGLIGRDDVIEQLAAQDVRSLLRRGAASGFAEVDFEGSDGRCYRARWSVRRARGKADGALQEQQVVLTAIDTGERLGGTKTETLEAIRGRLGLSFDQFRRSSLLAQGDFAAFLRAEDAERADLLERMTGTELYGELSMAAHRRAAEVDAALRAREDEVARIAVLDDEARLAAAAEQDAAAAAVEVAREIGATVEAAAAWSAVRAQLATELAAADGEGAAALAASAAAEPERARVERAAAAAAVRSTWDARARARADAQRAEAAWIAARGEHAAAAAAQGAAAEVDRAAGALTIAAVAVAERHGLEAGAAEAAGGASAPALLGGRIAEIAAAVERARVGLDGGASVATLARDWARWDKVLAREAAAALGAASARAAVSRIEAAAAAAAARRAAAEVERAAAVHELEAAQVVADGAEERRRGKSVETTRRAYDAAVRKLEGVAGLAELTAAARTAAAMAATAVARGDDARAATAAATAAGTAAGVDEDRGAAALREADGALARLRVAAGLDHERAALIDGEPCPLCGAAEHPWRGRGALDALVGEQAARVAALRGDARAAAARVATADAEAIAAAAIAAEADRAAAAARVEGAAAQAAWRAALTRLGELPLVDDPADPAAARFAADRVRAAAADRDRAGELFKVVERADREAREAQARVDAHRHNLELTGHAVAAADGAVRAAADELATARGAVAQQVAAQAVARDELAAALAAITGWAARLERDPAGFRAELATEIAGWRQHARALALATAAAARIAAAASEHRLGAERRAAAAEASLGATAGGRGHAATVLDGCTAALVAALAGAGLAEAEAAELLDADPDLVARLRAALAAIDRRLAAARVLLDERRRRLADHDAGAPARLASAEELAQARAAITSGAERLAAAQLRLRLDDDARARRAAGLAALDDVRREGAVHQTLRLLIGSADGKAFRAFAQSLSLDALLVGANHHLDQLAPRYQLERVPRTDLELQVVDRDMGSEVRSVHSLSGGESFLASLALALALSALSAQNVRVRTLLIDEGFGSLDPASLDVALAVLDALQASGRQVGIISHVPGLAERVGAQVAVRPLGGGRSTVRVRVAS